MTDATNLAALRIRVNVALGSAVVALVGMIGGFITFQVATIQALQTRITALETQVASNKSQIANNHRDAIARIDRVVIGNFEDVVIPVIKTRDVQIIGPDGLMRIRSRVNDQGNPVVSVLDGQGGLSAQLGHRAGTDVGVLYVKGVVNVVSTQAGGVVRIYDRNGVVRAGMGYNANADASSLDIYSAAGEIQTLIGNQPSGPYIQLFSGGTPALSFTRTPEGYVQTYTKQDPAKDAWGFVSFAATAHWFAQRLGIMR